MTVAINLLLQNVYAALINQQYHYAQFLLHAAINQGDSEMGLGFDVGIGLHRGRIRDVNQDYVCAVVEGTQERFGLFVVCDGMGGHVCGQEAAHLALQTLLEYVLPVLERDGALLSGEQLLVDGIQRANGVVYQQNQRRGHGMAVGDVHAMGTTITAVLLVRAMAYVANVGDSRTYCYGPSLRKITHDHSLVAQLLADGLLREEDIPLHPLRHQITRALGFTPSVEVDTFVLPFQRNKVLLLCSDGLWEMTDDRHIEAVLSASWANASQMANQLVQLANAAGGSDNIGCVVVRHIGYPGIPMQEAPSCDPTDPLATLPPSSSD